MAHNCPNCEYPCHCGGDIDDIFFEDSREAVLCIHCDDCEEPDIDDSVLFCPDCERPNQFGELCDTCARERPFGFTFKVGSATFKLVAAATRYSLQEVL